MDVARSLCGDGAATAATTSGHAAAGPSASCADAGCAADNGAASADARARGGSASIQGAGCQSSDCEDARYTCGADACYAKSGSYSVAESKNCSSGHSADAREISRRADCSTATFPWRQSRRASFWARNSAAGAAEVRARGAGARDWRDEKWNFWAFDNARAAAAVQ